MRRNVRTQKLDSLDHFISKRKQGGRNGEPKGLRSLEVEVHLVSLRLLNRELGRLCSAHDLINVRSGLMSYRNKIASKTYQAAGKNRFLETVAWLTSG
jgi:hypothetical protein